jgi:HEAT repeat protein
MRKLAPLAALIALACTLGAGSLLLQKDEAAPQSTQTQTHAALTEASPRVDAPAPAPAPRAFPTRLRLEPGQFWRYSLTTSHTAEGARGLELQGSLELRCYGELPGGGYLLGERYALEARSAHAELARAASQELLLEVDLQGNLSRLALPETSPDARNLLRTLVVARQTVLPSEVCARWQALGEDTTGRFVAEYRSEGERVSRARAYDSLQSGPSASGATVSIQGELAGQLRADGLPQTWAGEELVTVGAPQLEGAVADALAVRSRYAYELVETGRFAEPAAELTRAEGGFGPGAWGASLAGELSTQRHQAPLRPVDVVLDELAQLAAQGDSEAFTGSAPALFVELRERFRRDPAAVARAGLLARQRGTSLLLRSTVIDAIGSAGTAPAQRELLTLRGEVEDELLSSVYLGLAETSQPLPETLSALKDEGRAAGVRRDHARRAMGWLATRVETPQLKAQLAQELEGSLGEDPASDQVILEALGNAGQDRSLPALESYLEAEDEATRANAAAALRKLEAPEAQALLGTSARNDPSPRVRREAIRSFASRPPSAGALDALANAIRHDADVRVRLEALEGLIGWQRYTELNPEKAGVIESLLQEAAQSPAPALQERAKAALEG